MRNSQMQVDVYRPSSEEMEMLFINNEELARIGAYLNRFNPIRIMRMEGMEIRHSAILAWLLDPQETHSFGDKFLKAFLAESLRGHPPADPTLPSALDIAQSDLRDAVIRREWLNIDIFIHSPPNNWGFIVENKYRSRQRAGQLTGYINKIEKYFGEKSNSPRIRGIFLTLFDEDPEDPAYTPLKYADVCVLLSQLLSIEGRATSEEVRMFIEHYSEIIRSETGMDEERQEMERLARQLWRRHKKVLEFVAEHGAGTDFIIAAEHVFGTKWVEEDVISFKHGAKTYDYMYSFHSGKLFSFLPASWQKGFEGAKYEWPGCESWWAAYPLICWFQLYEGDDASGYLRLYAEVGPISNHEFRRSLIEEIRRIPDPDGLIRFQQGATEEGKRYSKFLKNNNVDISDVHDADEIARAMKILLFRFEPAFEKVAELLPKFCRYGSPL